MSKDQIWDPSVHSESSTVIGYGKDGVTRGFLGILGILSPIYLGREIKTLLVDYHVNDGLYYIK